MPSQLSPRLEQQPKLADAVRDTDRIVIPMLRHHSGNARALWDVAEDQRFREILTLHISDTWGYAAGDFAPSELRNESKLQSRVNELIGEMISPRHTRVPRERIELRDALASTGQLEQLRMNLGRIQGIAGARLQLHNQVRFAPRSPENYLLTDFAIEVDASHAEAVREAVVGCGFQLREIPPLIEREGVREALLQLVDKHSRDGEPRPKFALCFQLRDRETIHLLEVSREVVGLGDGSLDGFGFSALGVIPHAHSFKLYLAHPDDLYAAARANPDHPLFRDLRAGNCDFLHPDDGGEAFRNEFPDLTRA